MKNKVNEGLEMDMVTYKKVKGTLDPKTPVKIIDDKSKIPSTLPTTAVTEDAVEPEAIIEPQDKSTIKYLSNVKDSKTGEISKPFTIGDKSYQMVRGITPSKEIVMAVYCHDELNEAGENIIHPVDHFEENIVKPFIKENGYNADNYNSDERDFHDKNNLEPQPPVVKKEVPKEKINKPEPPTSLKLSEFKHFVINNKTGKVRKFKKIEELAKANMGEDERYMNLSQFKKHVDETLFGTKQKTKGDVNELVTPPLRPEVQAAIEQMVQKMKPYMDKINETAEKIQFIVKLTTMLQLDSSKYPALMDGLKKASSMTFGNKDSANDVNQTSTQRSTQTSVNESRVITKKELGESIKNKKVIKTIKIKDIK